MFTAATDAMREDRLGDLTRSALADRVEEVRRLKAATAAYELRLVDAIDALGDAGLDGAGVLRVAGRMSSRAAGGVSRTATQIAEMPKARRALEDGRITAEHAATLADAAEQVGAERVDDALVTTAAAVPADVLRKRSREWVERQRSEDDLADEALRLRRRRSARHTVHHDTMGAWVLELDPSTDQEVARAVDAVAAQLWRDDAADGRDPAAARSPQQRLADAMVLLLTGDHASAAGRHPKYQLTVIADLDRLSADPAGAAGFVDGRAIPQTLLERLACDAAITPVIFDGAGRPLWTGRDHRTATSAQWKALIARDRGCIGCGADPSRCEAHHVVAWIDHGTTDIDNLVLVCSRCHHDIHDRGMEVVETEQGLALRPRDRPATKASEAARPSHLPDYALFA